jgi:glucose-6-phosphate isomerase
VLPLPKIALKGRFFSEHFRNTALETNRKERKGELNSFKGAAEPIWWENTGLG